MNKISKQGYHFVGNVQVSGVFLGCRRSKMFPMGFIGACSLGVRNVIFGGFDINKNFFFSKMIQTILI